MVLGKIFVYFGLKILKGRLRLNGGQVFIPHGRERIFTQEVRRGVIGITGCLDAGVEAEPGLALVIHDRAAVV